MGINDYFRNTMKRFQVIILAIVSTVLSCVGAQERRPEHQFCTTEFCLKFGLRVNDTKVRINGYEIQFIKGVIGVTWEGGNRKSNIQLPEGYKINDIAIHQSGKFFLSLYPNTTSASEIFISGDLANVGESGVECSDGSLSDSVWELGALSRSGRYLLAKFRFDLQDPALGQEGAWALRQWKVYDFQEKKYVSDGIETWSAYAEK